MLHLEPLAAARYEAWHRRIRGNFIDDLIRWLGKTPDEAAVITHKNVDEMLPRREETPNHWIYELMDGNASVGALWIGRGSSDELFVYDVFLEPEHRGRGYGTQAMALVEQAARERGLRRIRLHVFGPNHAAVSLYRKVGFLPVSITMEKRLE